MNGNIFETCNRSERSACQQRPSENSNQKNGLLLYHDIDRKRVGCLLFHYQEDRGLKKEMGNENDINIYNN